MHDLKSRSQAPCMGVSFSMAGILHVWYWLCKSKMFKEAKAREDL